MLTSNDKENNDTKIVHDVKLGISSLDYYKDADNHIISSQQSMNYYRDEFSYDKINQSFQSFRNARDERKSKGFYKIVYTGYLAIFSGLLLYILVYTLSLYKYLSNNAYTLIGAISNLISSSGILLFTTIPIEYCNFDNIYEKNNLFRYCVSIFLFLMLCFLGISNYLIVYLLLYLIIYLYLGTFPPYLGFLLGILYQFSI